MSSARTYQRLIHLEDLLWELETGKHPDLSLSELEEEIRETKKKIKIAKQELEDAKR